MEENKYRLAGWLAIVQAVLFPLSFIMGLIEAIAAAKLFEIRRPFVGPADLLMVLFTIISIYTLLMFRKLLHERYNYHELDLLILIAIWWAIMFQVVGMGLTVLAMIFWPVNTLLLAVVYLVFMVSALVTIGIVDILIAVQLLKVKENFSEYVRVFAYVSMAAGISEVTVLLFPISMLLVPVTAIVLALIFFRDQQAVEYV